MLVWFLPKFYVRSLPIESGKDFDREKERLKLEDDTRKTIAQIVGGAVILGSLILTYNTFLFSKIYIVHGRTIYRPIYKSSCSTR